MIWKRIGFQITLFSCSFFGLRLYVHLDIIGGTIIGLLVGWLCYRLWRWAEQRWMHCYDPLFSRHDATIMATSVYITVAALAILAIFI